ncbi:MAG: nuclear transport factor 2 family protein [Gammaproteobacteria bacterium]|uniref:Nuclear transport factor 2 family protein n=1 Tax=Vreelandella titanicae TaxID=664683 RepID=A0A558JBW9_9GAMM|nr:nuclear transport factor 2 family protein [Halomonas titanicae]MBR9902519.1 nuclear transport factor 2 family protein [Gammaproteobacteria bacterium]TVU91130.1 nuclear transport factor 2 family protein [Halomonas titanicae]
MFNAKSRSGEINGTEQVRAFLSAMEARDLVNAERYLADDVVMQFPGAPSMQRLSEVVEWARNRYRSVSKTFHAVDQCDYATHCVVICHGELTVKWLDGTTSTGVRFIDRFELTEGLITRQDVWNDLALTQTMTRLL